MKSFETAPESEHASRDDIEEKAYNLLGQTMKSIDYITDKLRFIRRYAGKIDDSSTKTFIGSFQSDIDEIKTAYGPIESFYDCVSKLSASNGEFELEPESQFYLNKIQTERREEDKTNIKKKSMAENHLSDIKWQLENTSKSLLGKLEFAQNSIRMFKKNNNDISFIDESFAALDDLNDSMKKLLEIKSKITEYSQK